MGARRKWIAMFVLMSTTAGAQDSPFSSWKMMGDTIIALPLPFARGSTTAADVATIEVGLRIARELGYESLEAAMPSCFQATLNAMAAQDEAALARGARSPYGSGGDPQSIRRSWAGDIRESCLTATAEWLLFDTREYAERTAAEWESMWHAFILPMRRTSYWSTQRSAAAAAGCGEMAGYDLQLGIAVDPAERDRRRRNRGGSAADNVSGSAAEFCRNLTASRSAASVPQDDATRIALEIAAAAGLTEEEAATLNRFAFDLVRPENQHYRLTLAAEVCERIDALEGAANVGRALNRVQNLSIEHQRELFRTLPAYLGAGTIEKLRRYAVENHPTVRLVDYEAWYAKFSAETAAAMARGMCASLLR